MNSQVVAIDNVAMTVEFECETVLLLGPVDAFDLSLSVDAHTASLAASGERATTSVGATLGLGDDVTWRARHFGLPWTMTSRIVEWERPTRFVDEQVHGPFAMFRHEHLFEPHGADTRMTDRVKFRAPYGPIGTVVERVFLARYLCHLIQTRNAYLASRPTDDTA